MTIMTVPKDPVMLLSWVNTQLRDRYETLDALCEDAGLERASLEDTLTGIDYRYSEEQNQFI